MLGEEIRARRKRLGLTQKALAALINVKPTTMCQYENGTNEMSFAVLKSIAEALKCSTVDLAYEELALPGSSETFDEKIIGAAGQKEDEPAFADPLDTEIFKLLKDLDKVAKEKVIAYMRDQKSLTVYYSAVRRRR